MKLKSGLLLGATLFMLGPATTQPAQARFRMSTHVTRTTPHVRTSKHYRKSTLTGQTTKRTTRTKPRATTTRTRTSGSRFWQHFFLFSAFNHLFHRQARASAPQTVPTETLAKSVLTTAVKQQLGTKVTYNHAGAFVIANNQTKLNAKVTAAPYVNNQIDSQQRPTVANALLNQTTRQTQDRASTGNGSTNWKPAGFQQVTNLKGTYTHAYDRGHLIGYALAGKLKGFDSSEANPKNIVTQTAWANEARSKTSTGQNYYETQIRQALDQHKTVRYRVTAVYQGNNQVPAGNHLEAKSKDGSLQFNVFVPNVQSGIQINYLTGKVTQTK